MKAILLLFFILSFEAVCSQHLELVANSKDAIRNNKKFEVGLIYESKNVKRKTEGFLNGTLKWRHFKIKSDVCRVKRGKMKIKKKNTLDCEIPLTAYYKKDKYSQTVKLELLYNGNVTLNFQPKYKKRIFLAWLFLGLLSGRDGVVGRDGLDAPDLIGDFDLVNQCGKEMLQLVINYKDKEYKEFLNPQFQGKYIINLTGGDGEDGDDGCPEDEKRSSGDGGDGGNGGNGGNLHLRISEKSKLYLNKVELLNDGGHGGESGQAGGWSGYDGSNGYNGRKGLDLTFSIK